MAVNEDALMRLQGQHVPEAPCTAHGQMSFVFSAPVCLFPSRRPQDSWNPVSRNPLMPLPWVRARGPLTWMKSEAVPLVTIVALFRELRQDLESKLLKPQSVLKIKYLAFGIQYLASRWSADCQLPNALER